MKETLFTKWLPIAFQTIGFTIISFSVYLSRKKTRKSRLNIIRLYILICFLDYFLSIPIDTFFNERRIQFNSLLINLFTYFEIATFYCFFYKTIYRRLQKIIMLALFACFSAYYIYDVWGFDKIFTFNRNSFGIESVMITVPCFFYFYEIVNTNSEINFKRDPNFFVATGAFVYFSITTQYYLLSFFDEVIPNYKNIANCINLFFYDVMLGLFAIAFFYDRKFLNNTELNYHRSINNLNLPSS